MTIIIQKIIDRLKTETNFPIVEPFKEFLPTTLEERKLYVGVLTYEPLEKLGEGFAEYGERIVTTIGIYIISDNIRWEEDIQQVYKAITGWTYDDVCERELSVFSLNKGELIDIKNGRVFWFFQFNITLPQL